MDKVLTAKNTDIKHIIESETNLKFDSQNKLAECPFCGSGSGKNSTPAFSIHPKKNIFSCFSCNEKGNSIEFIIKKHPGFNNKQAIDYIIKDYSGKMIDEILSPGDSIKNDDTFRKTLYALKSNDIKPASDYLISRSINVTALPSDCYCYDKLLNAIGFIDSENKLINKRYIEPKEGSSKASFVKGSEIKNSVYDKLYKPDQEAIYLTEGVINAMSLPELSSLAIFTTENKFTNKEKLSRYITDKKVILAFDNDTAGNKCTDYYNAFILDSGIEIKSLSRLVLPPDQDLNNLLKSGKLTDHLASTSSFDVIWENQNHIDILLKVIEPDSEDPYFEFDNYQFFKKEGRYYTRIQAGKALKDISISNFLMEILYHFVDGSNNTKRLIKIQRYTGEIITVEVLSSETKPETFETILKSHNCTFLGSSYLLKSIFMVLMDNQREAFSIEMLGYIPEFDLYAFSDCLITNDLNLIKTNQIGIATHGKKSFYLPSFAQSNINNKAFTNSRKFRYKEGSLNFHEWSKLIYQAYNVNGSISVCYLILSMFRDLVFQESGFFPFLYLFGQPGVGKSSFIDFFLRLFGEKEIGTSIKNSTVKGIARTCGQKRNALVFLKEFENTIDREMIAFFKNAYDGATYTIAQKSMDNKTDAFLVESAIIIDGNVLPTAESALYDRMIVLHFESHNFSQDETEAFKRLGIESEKGLGQIIKEILSHREYFKANFKTGFKEIYNELKYDSLSFEGFDLKILPERTIRHISLLLSPFKVLFQKLKFPFEFNELSKKIIQDAIEKYHLLNDIKDVAVFWDAINWERNKDYSAIQDTKHFIKEHQSSILYLKIPELYPFYMQYCKLNNLNYVDKASLLSLLTSSSYPPFIPGIQKGEHKSVNKRPLGRCYMFKFDTSIESNSIIINDKQIYL